MSSRCQSQVLLFVQCVEGMGLWDQIDKVSMQSGLIRYSSDPKMVFCLVYSYMGLLES